MADPIKLEFRYGDFDKEMTNLRGLARRLLQADGEEVLSRAQHELAATKGSTGQQRWGITDRWPLRTKGSREYDKAGQQTGEPVFGQLDFVWEITPLSAERFAMTGNA